jgi:hypothetical protein
MAGIDWEDQTQDLHMAEPLSEASRPSNGMMR